VQSNEVDTSTILSLGNFDPDNPDSLSSPNVVDPDLSPPITDELIVGFERELMPSFSLGANYIYKRFSNRLWNDWASNPGIGINYSVDMPYPGVTSSDFVPVMTDFEGQTLTYYELPFQRPAGELLTNWSDHRQRFQGFEVTVNKRLSNRWMLNSGFTFGDHREYYDSEAAVFDPTNIDLRRGGEMFTLSDIRMNSRWVFKLDGMVELPAGIHLAGKLNGRQGYMFPPTFWVQTRGGGIGPVDVLLEPIGESRLEDLWIADLRMEKTFDLGRSRISGMFDIFNLFNSATVLARENRQNANDANRIDDVLSPRVIRFGVRWAF
jgi:hypothetical protein